jgi:YbbR domain-containing protein
LCDDSDCMKKRRTHIIIATALFAVIVWVSVTLREQYQTTISAPLLIENLPAGTSIQTPLPKLLQLKFRGSGWRLAALLLRTEVQCVLDLKSVPRNQHVITLKNISERLNVPVDVQPVDMKPESLFVEMDAYREKPVPVVLDTSLSFRDGYGQVGGATVVPESVTIGGAQTVLRNIRSWSTARHSFDGLKTSVTAEVPLADTGSYLLTFSPAKVRVHITVQPFAEKPFSGLPVEVLAAPPGREVILIPPKIEVVVRGGIEELTGLALRDFRATVDYRHLVNDSSGYTDVEIVAPGSVQIVSRRPEKLQYVLRKRLE